MPQAVAEPAGAGALPAMNAERMYFLLWNGMLSEQEYAALPPLTKRDILKLHAVQSKDLPFALSAVIGSPAAAGALATAPPTGTPPSAPRPAATPAPLAAAPAAEEAAMDVVEVMDEPQVVTHNLKFIQSAEQDTAIATELAKIKAKHRAEQLRRVADTQLDIEVDAEYNAIGHRGADAFQDGREAGTMFGRDVMPRQREPTDRDVPSLLTDELKRVRGNLLRDGRGTNDKRKIVQALEHALEVGTTAMQTALPTGTDLGTDLEIKADLALLINDILSMAALIQHSEWTDQKEWPRLIHILADAKYRWQIQSLLLPRYVIALEEHRNYPRRYMRPVVAPAPVTVPVAMAPMSSSLTMPSTAVHYPAPAPAMRSQSRPQGGGRGAGGLSPLAIGPHAAANVSIPRALYGEATPADAVVNGGNPICICARCSRVGQQFLGCIGVCRAKDRDMNNAPFTIFTDEWKEKAYHPHRANGRVTVAFFQAAAGSRYAGTVAVLVDSARLVPGKIDDYLNAVRSTGMLSKQDLDTASRMLRNSHATLGALQVNVSGAQGAHQ